MNKPETKNRSPKEGWSIFPLIIILVLDLWAFNLLLAIRWSDSWGNRGTFGDFFATSNTLFSGLALAGVIYALIMQRRELRMQREELALTRQEFKGQKDEMHQQNEHLYLQRFETTFFHQLRILLDTADSTTTKILGTLQNGDNAFKHFVDALKSTDSKMKSDDDRLTDFYNLVNSNSPTMVRFFKNLSSLFLFVSNSRIPSTLKTDNLTVIRSQLTDESSLTVHYYGATPLGKRSIRDVANRYGFFNERDALLILKPSDRELYEATAFRSD